MARGHKCTCYVCGARYEYCESCAIVKPNYNANRFCSHEHQDIFAILSKHGCNLITADEALAELAAFNIDEIKLAEDIAAHIEDIKSEIIICAETEVSADEE
jgi:hypothetical protein